MLGLFYYRETNGIRYVPKNLIPDAPDGLDCVHRDLHSRDALSQFGPRTDRGQLASLKYQCVIS